MPRPSSEDIRLRAIWMKEVLGYQVDEVAASSKRSLSFDPTTLIEILYTGNASSVTGCMRRKA